MLTLILASLGTPPVCYTAAGYAAQSYVATPYIAQSHAGYAPTYQNKIVTAFIPVVQQDYRVEIVGDAARAQAYAASRLQADTNLISSINNFAKTLDTFRVQVAQATGIQQQAQQAQSQAPPPPQGQPPAAAPPDPTPPAPGPAGEPVGTFQQGAPSQARLAATQVLSRRCASCHSGESASGGFKIFEGKDVLANLTRDMVDTIDEVGYSGYAKKRDEATGRVTKLRMPPNGKPLGSDEYNAVRAFKSEFADAIAGIVAGSGPR